MYKDSYLTVLKQEFAAADGSFMQSLRIALKWDPVAFNKLIEAMLKCCVDREAVEHTYDVMVERWIAEGFWYYDHFIRQWVQNPSFPRIYADSYYAHALDRLHLLASWFFRGRCPCENRDVFGPITPVPLR